MGNFAGRGIFIFRPPEGDNFIEKIYRSYKPAAGGGIRGLLRRDGGVISAAVFSHHFRRADADRPVPAGVYLAGIR